MSRRFVLEQIAFGSARPIVAALGERGYAVDDRVYKPDSTELQSCSRSGDSSGWNRPDPVDLTALWNRGNTHLVRTGKDCQRH